MYKALIALIALASSSAFAVPGSSHLSCKSRTGAKQKLQLEIGRMIGPGTVNPNVKMSVNGKAYDIQTPDLMKQYGESIHDAALGVIVVTAETDEDSKAQLHAQVMAVPGSVKAFDQQGKPVKWSLKDDDGGECIDGYGKATFHGVFTGYLIDDAGKQVPTDNQIMDCTLDYNTGSAC